MYNPTQNIEETKPPQGLLIPKHTVIKLDDADAVRFHAGLEEVRAALPPHGTHWLKNKGPEDFVSTKSQMLAIEEDGELVAGALVSAYTRGLGNKLPWYPWEAAGEHTGLIGSVWSKSTGRGLGKALIEHAKEVIKTELDIKGDPLKGGLKYVLAGVAENNIDSREMFKKRGFNEIRRLEADPIHGKPMVYVRHLIL